MLCTECLMLVLINPPRTVPTAAVIVFVILEQSLFPAGVCTSKIQGCIGIVPSCWFPFGAV